MTLVNTESMRNNGQAQCTFTAEVGGFVRLCNQYAGHSGAHTFNGTTKKVTGKA
jgi:hypothetical protein